MDPVHGHVAYVFCPVFPQIGIGVKTSSFPGDERTFSVWNGLQYDFPFGVTVYPLPVFQLHDALFGFQLGHGPGDIAPEKQPEALAQEVGQAHRAGIQEALRRRPGICPRKEEHLGLGVPDRSQKAFLTKQPEECLGVKPTDFRHFLDTEAFLFFEFSVDRLYDQSYFTRVVWVVLVQSQDQTVRQDVIQLVRVHLFESQVKSPADRSQLRLGRVFPFGKEEPQQDHRVIPGDSIAGNMLGGVHPAGHDHAQVLDQVVMKSAHNLEPDLLTFDRIRTVLELDP